MNIRDCRAARYCPWFPDVLVNTPQLKSVNLSKMQAIHFQLSTRWCKKHPVNPLPVNYSTYEDNTYLFHICGQIGPCKIIFDVKLNFGVHHLGQSKWERYLPIN